MNKIHVRDSVPRPDSPEDFLFEMGLHELELQKEMRDHVDEKTGVILGFALVSIIEILGFLLLVAAEKNYFDAVHWSFFAAFGVGLTSVFISAIFCVLEIWPARYYYIDLDRLRNRVRESDSTATIKTSMLRRLSACAYMNHRRTEWKNKLAMLAVISAGAALLAFAAAVLLIMIAIWHNPRVVPAAPTAAPQSSRRAGGAAFSGGLPRAADPSRLVGRVGSSALFLISRCPGSAFSSLVRFKPHQSSTIRRHVLVRERSAPLPKSSQADCVHALRRAG